MSIIIGDSTGRDYAKYVTGSRVERVSGGGNGQRAAGCVLGTKHLMVVELENYNLQIKSHVRIKQNQQQQVHTWNLISIKYKF